MSLTQLSVVAPTLGATGYERHSRAFLAEFVRMGIEIDHIEAPWGDTVIHGRRTTWPTRPFTTDARFPVVLHSRMPSQMPAFEGHLNVIYTMFEATPTPAHWRPNLPGFDLIVVPTASSRDSIIAGGADPDRVAVSPLGIDLDTFSRQAAPLPLLFDDGSPVAAARTRFLNVSAWGDRKNPVGLITAWLKETRPDDDAVLVLKWDGYAPGIESVFPLARERAGRDYADAAPITTVQGMLSDEAMVRLFHSVTHYISASCGEGWDLPMSEAAVSGLRLIAPDNTAYRAYLDATIATLMPCEPTAAPVPNRPVREDLFAGATWWPPRQEAVVAAIRAAIDGRDTPARDPREALRHLTWEAAARQLISTIETRFNL
jgi:glycosyltransferase involved in cell wall biosynthesis